jgi:PleD family two-component response regulator
MNDTLPDDAPPAVLIVNDEPHSLIALTAALENGPWRVVTAGSGLGAFKELLLGEFAVIVMDVQMPGLNGFEVAEMIRTRPRSAATPILFCSATAQTPDDLFKGYELGAVDYLLTPVLPRVLRSKIGVFVELYQQKRRLARMVAELENARATLERQNRELMRTATRDAVTGCLNPLGFELTAAPLFDAARRGAELSLVAVVLDHPGAPDEALIDADSDPGARRLARFLGAVLGDDDELCRASAEQFVIALPGTTIDQAVQRAEQLCGRLRAAPGLKAHLGVTSTALGAMTLEALVTQALLAARAARRAGGDTVRCFDQLPGAAAPGG